MALPPPVEAHHERLAERVHGVPQADAAGVSLLGSAVPGCFHPES
jgi:hypothetical protein